MKLFSRHVLRKFGLIFSSFSLGLLFGFGLIVAGMSNPAKVSAFLDISGSWDPSLALVMAGAIMVASPAFAYAKRRQHSFLHLPLQMPTQSQPDTRLLVGSAIFGCGWGLAGICPGPAVVLLGAGLVKPALFFMAMVAGMVLFSLLEKLLQSWNNKAANSVTNTSEGV